MTKNQPIQPGFLYGPDQSIIFVNLQIINGDSHLQKRSGPILGDFMAIEQTYIDKHSQKDQIIQALFDDKVVVLQTFIRIEPELNDYLRNQKSKGLKKVIGTSGASYQ